MADGAGEAVGDGRVAGEGAVGAVGARDADPVVRGTDLAAEGGEGALLAHLLFGVGVVGPGGAGVAGLHGHAGRVAERPWAQGVCAGHWNGGGGGRAGE